MSDSMLQCIVFSLAGQDFAIDASFVRELVLLGSAHRTPAAPPHVRGIMRLRDRTVTLVDLRSLLGIRSYQDVHRDGLDVFKKRRQDHLNWITELESSVREHRDFALALDPHQCAFGKWYDEYRPDDAVLALKMQQFARPHQGLHRLGTRIRMLVEQGRRAEAFALIEESREKELSELIRLFDETVPMMAATQREIVILISDGSRQLGLVVDDAKEIHQFASQDLDEISANSQLRSARDWVKGVGLDGDQMIVVLECARVFELGFAPPTDGTQSWV